MTYTVYVTCHNTCPQAMDRETSGRDLGYTTPGGNRSHLKHAYLDFFDTTWHHDVSRTERKSGIRVELARHVFLTFVVNFHEVPQVLRIVRPSQTITNYTSLRNREPVPSATNYSGQYSSPWLSRWAPSSTSRCC
jgi:hypothetical protein